MFDSLPDMARKRAELSPNARAFADQTTGRDWSFQDVNDAADAVAAGLLREGLRAGDRLAILCQNRAEFFVTLFACQKTGIILCPLNWRQPTPELADNLMPIGARALISDHAFHDTATSLASACDLRHWTIEHSLRDWMATKSDAFVADIPATRPWYLLFTSGTTGRSKAVIQTARMAWANAINIGQAVQLGASDHSICFLPLFHTAGINLYTLPLFLNGGTSTVLAKFDEAAVLALLKTGEITQFFGVPAIYQALSLNPELGQINWRGLRCGCGGAPLPEPLIHAFAELGVSVLNGMGMTETGPTVFLMDPAAATTKIGSVGKPQIMTEARLADVPDGREGEGEVQLRGPGITPGYFENSAATQDAFTADGWLATGDVARRDSDGYYFVIDRIKDMFISGGENVYPAEVERALNSHPAILETAVIGLPDARWGEVGAAFILLRPQATLDPASLRPWCRELLAAYKVPAQFHLVETFPRTAAGKIRKHLLRDQLTDD